MSDGADEWLSAVSPPAGSEEQNVVAAPSDELPARVETNDADVEERTAAARMIDSLHTALFAESGSDAALIRVVYEAFGDKDWAPELLAHLQTLLVVGAFGDPACIPLLRTLQRLDQLIDDAGPDERSSLAQRTAAIAACLRRLRYDWGVAIVHAIAVRDVTYVCRAGQSEFIGAQSPSGFDSTEAHVNAIVDALGALPDDSSQNNDDDESVAALGHLRLRVARLAASLWYWRLPHVTEGDVQTRDHVVWSMLRRIASRRHDTNQLWHAVLDRLEYVADAAPYAGGECCMAALLMFTLREPPHIAFDDAARQAMSSWKTFVQQSISAEPPVGADPEPTTQCNGDARRSLIDAHLLFDWPRRADRRRLRVQRSALWPQPDDDCNEPATAMVAGRVPSSDSLDMLVGRLFDLMAIELPHESLYRLAYTCMASDPVRCGQAEATPETEATDQETERDSTVRKRPSSERDATAGAKRSRKPSNRAALAADRLPPAPTDQRYQLCASQLFARTTLFNSPSSAAGKCQKTFFATVRADTATLFGIEHDDTAVYFVVGPCTHESYCDALEATSTARQVLALDDMYPAPSAVHRIVLRANVHNTTNYAFDTYMTYMLLRLPPPFDVIDAVSLARNASSSVAYNARIMPRGVPHTLLEDVDSGDATQERAVASARSLAEYGLEVVDPLSSRFRSTSLYSFGFASEQRIAYLMQIVWRFAWQMPNTSRTCAHQMLRVQIQDNGLLRFLSSTWVLYDYVLDDTVLLKPRSTLFRTRMGTRLRAAIEQVLHDDVERLLLKTALERVAAQWTRNAEALAAIVDRIAQARKTTGADVVQHIRSTYAQLAAALDLQRNGSGDEPACTVQSMWSNIL